MSRTRPSCIPNWTPLQFRSTLVLTTRTGRPSSLTPVDHSRRKHHNQLLHTTTSHKAARPAPTSLRTRRRVAQASRSLAPENPVDYLPHGPNARESPGIAAELKYLEQNGFRLASEMLHDGTIDKSMTPKKFKRIGKALLEQLLGNSRPFPDSIKKIAQDEGVTVDTIYDIVNAIAPNKQHLMLLANSCALAGSRIATYTIASAHLRGLSSGLQLTAVLAQVKILATRRDSDEHDVRDPRAMLIYAKFLGLRGDYAQALSLVEELLKLTEPKTRLIQKEDLVYAGNTEPPWELYFRLRRALVGRDDDFRVSARDDVKDPDLLDLHRPMKKGQNEKKVIHDSEYSQKMVRAYLDPTDIDVLRLGAEDYQHPFSLIRYAVVRGWTEGIHEYEKYMVQAASSGSRVASYYLANFYYLVYLGRYPRPVARPGTGAAKLEGTGQMPDPGFRLKEQHQEMNHFNRLLSYFRPRPLRDYRGLAMEWYSVGWGMNSIPAALRLSTIHILDSATDIAETLLDEIEAVAKDQGVSEEYAKTIAYLRSNLSSEGVHLSFHNLPLGEELITGRPVTAGR
ncbi:hypothetical protein BJX70DRAFT_117886 [Aspergillus crustosus]